MTEIISGIQVIKMYAWEIPFKNLVKEIRSSEISYLTKMFYCRATFPTLAIFLDKLSVFIILICFVYLGEQITSNKVFSLAQFFNMIQVGLCFRYPLAISIGAETLISIKRIREFLMLEEKEVTSIGVSTEGSVQLDQVCANRTATTPILEELSINIQPGMLCAIVGDVGSGKSSILQVSDVFLRLYFINSYDETLS